MTEKRKEIYISLDIEATGPVVIRHSMVSLGAAAFTEDGQELGSFQVNLDRLLADPGDPDTDAWWAALPAATREAAFCNPLPPPVAMRSFCEWVRSFAYTTPVAICYPAGYDWTWTWTYLTRFVAKELNPFSFAAIDVKTLAWIALGGKYREAGKRRFRPSWFPKDAPHTHIAREDAIEQGKIAMAILAELRERLRPNL